MSVECGIVSVSRSWRALIKAKREQAIYRITLSVRGKEVVKNYDNYQDYEKWLTVYRERETNGDRDLKIMKTELVYR